MVRIGRVIALLGAVSSVAACGGSKQQGGADLAQSGQMDLASASDLYMCVKDESLKLVVNKFLLPTTSDPASSESYAYDLNGDGVGDNKFGALMSLLNGSLQYQGQTLQTTMDAAVTTKGTVLLLLRVQADSLATSECGELTTGLAATQANPVVSGGGTFTLASTPTTLPATITSAALQTPSPVTASAGLQVRMKLPLGYDGSTVEFAIDAAHVEGNVDVANQRFLSGKLNGAIRYSEFKQKILPALASAFTQLLADPSASTTTQAAVKSLLDKGCTTGELAGDSVISVCELTGGALKSALLPDLDLYSDTSRDDALNVVGSYGTYAPKASAANALENDSVSIGMGLTAASALF